ncbi:MAG: peptidyl-prolyl cis-trans isomerase [Verrucomicrobiota bacterium]
MKGVLGPICAIAVGIVCSELLCRSVSFRDALGRVAGRGHLIAIANGRGFYENDLEIHEATAASDLVIAENLDRISSREKIDPTRPDHELSLYRAEFGDESAFTHALRASGLSLAALREKVAGQLRALQWLEKQIAAEPAISDRDCRNFYETHRDLFEQPARFRAAHIFLAAHAETPPEDVEAKAKAIEALALRVSGGEPVSQLAVETSEDEASKARGGDLGFFSAARMPPKFFAEVEKLRLGETSKPFRSHLGFHIVQLNETKPSRLLPFEEARAEITLALVNERRALITVRLAANMTKSAYARPN